MKGIFLILVVAVAAVFLVKKFGPKLKAASEANFGFSED